MKLTRNQKRYVKELASILADRLGDDLCDEISCNPPEGKEDEDCTLFETIHDAVLIEVSRQLRGTSGASAPAQKEAK